MSAICSRSRHNLGIAAAAVSGILLGTAARADIGTFRDNLQKTAQKTGHLQNGGEVTVDTFLLKVGFIIQVGLSLTGIVFLVLALYAGFKWMMSAGNTKDVEEAQHTLRNAVVGLVVVMAAYAITSFVTGQLWLFSAPPPSAQH